MTCGSMHSRNRRAGILIGQGHTPEAAGENRRHGGGVFGRPAAWQLAQQNGVEMPITEQCYRVCYEGQDPKEALRALMGRPKKQESESAWI